MKLFLIFLLFCQSLGICAAQNPGSDSTDIDSTMFLQGKEIFENGIRGQWACASCHKINADFVAPRLKGITRKYDREWLYQWIRNSEDLIMRGDSVAIDIFEEWGLLQPKYDLTDSEIDNILYFIEVESIE